MNKNSWIGVTSGCVSGLVGAILTSSGDFSLLSVGLIGLVIGLLTGLIFNYFTKK